MHSLEDIESQLKESESREVDHNENRIKLQGEVDACSDFILSLEEKVYKANSTTLELLKQLKEDEIEIHMLKDHIKDLRVKVQVYVPVKSDPVDKKVGDFVNSYHDKHKIKNLLHREGEGIYAFGTKRTAIRVDNDKINVRVGGGYMGIEQFLE